MLRLLLTTALLASASAYSGAFLKRLAASASFDVSREDGGGCHPDRRAALASMAGVAALEGGGCHPDRRAALARMAGVAALVTNCQPAYAGGASVLEARSAENSLAVPPYGMEASDIFYPSYFLGSWKAVSKTKDIIAPCGMELFTGGKAAYDSATQTEIKQGDDLLYKARFVTQRGGEESGGTYIAADREYNAREIAKAAMGAYSVVDTVAATPNRYSCVLAPPDGSSNLICVDILALARKSETVSPEKFVCSEFVRQIVSPAQRNNPNAPPRPPLSQKDIETISIYTVEGKDRIQCLQRTATFLVPSQTDPIAFKKWQFSQGRPVDVRYYDVTYSRIA